MSPAIGLPLGSFLAAALVLIPLPSQWRARNIPTLANIGWLFIVNIAHGIDSIVWAHDVVVRWVVWCDIVTHLDVGLSIALPVACFRLSMRLERVSSMRHAHSTPEDKRKRIIIDCVMCLGIPPIFIALFYIVQGHRFDIVERFGCRSESYVSIPEFFINRLPPVLFALGTFVFAGMSFLHFLRRRATFSKHLHSTGSLSPSRYLRLMALALIEMFWSLFVTTMSMAFSYRAGLRPWISWGNVHSNFSRIGQFPLLLISNTDLALASFLWWSVPVSAYIFFALFGSSREAFKPYCEYATWFRRVVLRQTVGHGSRGASSLPYYSAPRYPLVPIDVRITESKLDDSETMLKTSSLQPELTASDSMSITTSRFSYDERHVDIGNDNTCVLHDGVNNSYLSSPMTSSPVSLPPVFVVTPPPPLHTLRDGFLRPL